MRKRTTKYTAWKVSGTQWFIVCWAKRTGDTELIIVDTNGTCKVLEPQKDFPNLRLYYPVPFEAVPAQLRALVRGEFTRVQEERYGKEPEFTQLKFWDTSK